MRYPWCTACEEKDKAFVKLSIFAAHSDGACHKNTPRCFWESSGCTVLNASPLCFVYQKGNLWVSMSIIQKVSIVSDVSDFPEKMCEHYVALLEEAWQGAELTNNCSWFGVTISLYITYIDTIPGFWTSSQPFDSEIMSTISTQVKWLVAKRPSPMQLAAFASVSGTQCGGMRLV